LRATSFDQTSCLAEGQECIKQALGSIIDQEALTKIVEQGEVEAGIGEVKTESMSDSQGALLLPSLLRTGRAPLSASGSSKPYAARMSAPLTVGR
jgi:hypothetical protein